MRRHPSARGLSSIIAIGTLAFASLAAGASSQEKADELAREGIELRRTGDDSGALPLFQQAHQMAPTPRSAVQLGLVEQALGRWADAEEHLTAGLRNPADPWIHKNRPVIDESLRTVKRHVGSVDVTGDPVGAEVLVNGRKVGKLPLASAIRVNGGTVDVEARAEGHKAGFRTVNVGAGQNQAVVIRLEKIVVIIDPPPGKPSPPWQRWAGIGALAGGAVAAGVGTFGILRHNDRVGSFNDRCDESPAGALNKITHQPDSTCAELQAEYKDASTLSIIGFSVAGALAVTGAILLLTAPDAPAPSAAEPPPQVSWICAPTLGMVGASCMTRF